MPRMARFQEPARVTVQDIRNDKISRRVDGKVTVVPKSKVTKDEGIDELLQCLNPGTFDISCVFKNLDWLFNSALNNLYLNCNLGTEHVDPGDPDRRVSSGACLSWWGVAGLGQPQKCISFNSAAQAATTCQKKCTGQGQSYEASGCDGMSIWCWCRV